MLLNANTAPNTTKPSHITTRFGASAMPTSTSASSGMVVSITPRVPSRSTTWLANRKLTIAPAGWPSSAMPSCASSSPSASCMSGMRLNMPPCASACRKNMMTIGWGSFT